MERKRTKGGAFGLAALGSSKEQREKAERVTARRRPPRSERAMARGLGPMTDPERKALTQEQAELTVALKAQRAEAKTERAAVQAGKDRQAYQRRVSHVARMHVAHAAKVARIEKRRADHAERLP